MKYFAAVAVAACAVGVQGQVNPANTQPVNTQPVNTQPVNTINPGYNTNLNTYTNPTGAAVNTGANPGYPLASNPLGNTLPATPINTLGFVPTNTLPNAGVGITAAPPNPVPVPGIPGVPGVAGVGTGITSLNNLPVASTGGFISTTNASTISTPLPSPNLSHNKAGAAANAAPAFAGLAAIMAIVAALA